MFFFDFLDCRAMSFGVVWVCGIMSDCRAVSFGVVWACGVTSGGRAVYHYLRFFNAGFENQIWFSEHTFGFQNTHTVLSNFRMKTVFRKLPYLVFKNQIWLSKHTFSFQNTHLVFDHTFQIRYFSANSVFFKYLLKPYLVFKTHIWFLKPKYGS